MAATIEFESVAPDPKQAAAVDANLRARLADSFDYLATLTSATDAARLAAIGRHLADAPVSPFVFSLYSLLVTEFGGGGDRASVLIGEIEKALTWPAKMPPLGLGDTAVPDAWWQHYHTLLDTDPDRDFRPVAPASKAANRAINLIDAAFELMARCDASLHDEVRSLVRLPVLAAPSSESDQDNFNGASTFFFWGGILLNAEHDRGTLAMVDLLVHEASHLLLFGLVEGKALTRNDATERYSSPLRSDPRPIDGIFHACFVATRVAEAITRLLESGRLTAEETMAAIDRRDRNKGAARAALASLEDHAEPSDRGDKILNVLRFHLREDPAASVSV